MAASAAWTAWTAWTVLVASLLGCAPAPIANTVTTMPAYQGPSESEPHGRLLSRGNLPPDSRFAVLLQRDNLRCADTVRLALGNTQQPPPPVRLAADRLVTLDYAILAAGSNRACVTRWSFTPRAGRSYLIQGAVVGAQCPAALLDVTTPDRPQAPPDLVSRAGAGQNCLPLEQSAKASAGPNALIRGGQHNGEAVLLPNATTRDLEGLIKP